MSSELILSDSSSSEEEETRFDKADSEEDSSSDSESSSSSSGDAGVEEGGESGERSGSKVNWEDEDVSAYVNKRKITDKVMQEKQAAVEKIVARKQNKRPPTMAMQDPAKVN